MAAPRIWRIGRQTLRGACLICAAVALILTLLQSHPADLQRSGAFVQPPVSNAEDAPAVHSRRALLGLSANLAVSGLLMPARAAEPTSVASGASALSAVMPPTSPEDMLMRMFMGSATQGGNSTEGGPLAALGAEGGQDKLATLGIGAVVLFTIFSVFKFLIAGVGGLFLFKEFDQQFGKDGRKSNKVIEKTLRRLAGEPVDLLDERRLKVVRLNDELVSFQASLAEQTSGPGAAASVREGARRQRFLAAWQFVLDGLGATETERKEVEQAVAKFTKEENERREEFGEQRSGWIKNMLQDSFVGSRFGRFQVAGGLDKQLKLQEELVSEIKKALPKEKVTKLQKVFADKELDLGWLADPKIGDTTTPDQVYVLNFDGDTTASGVAALQQEVTAVLGAPKKPSEVVLVLKSPGGTVTGYGLAGAQLLRFKEHGVKLVVCVDELAASGGYLMACVADKIFCSPFAAIGSIGVISGIPNAAERLEREGLKVVQTTAGKWKRTIDPFQTPTPEAMAKAKEDIGMIYKQFSSWVKQNRPSVTIEEVATGEVWFGPDALAKGLVDELKTSAEYLRQHMAEGHEVLELSYSRQETGLAASLASASGGQMAQAQAICAAADALRAAGVVGSSRPTDIVSSAQDAMRSAMQAVDSDSTWPAGATQPRMEARGPLGDLW